MVGHLVKHFGSEPGKHMVLYVEVADIQGNFLLFHDENGKIMKSGYCKQCYEQKCLGVLDENTGEIYCSEECLEKSQK